ncbi:MAG: cyclase family protein [Blastocatellia bacterium]
MKIFDVTVPISKDMPVYPGDPAVKIERKATIDKKEAKYNLSRYSFSSHIGTHVDAPFHFIADGKTVDQLPLEILIGRTRVVEVTAPRIDEAALKEFTFTADARVLFKTRNSYLWSQPRFVEDYVYITPGAARVLVNEGIKLVGIDYLSVEQYGSDTFETHLTLLKADTLIIEGLDLREVEPGDYEMICLPMKFQGGDGSPARVILRQ